MVFDYILDSCINRIKNGEGVDEILTDYPAYAEEIKPLLETVKIIQQACNVVPSPEAKKVIQQRLQSAIRNSSCDPNRSN